VHSNNKSNVEVQPIKQILLKTTMKSFCCRQCGGGHLTIRCPLRSPEEMPKTVKQMVAEAHAKEEEMPYQCWVKLRPDKTSRVYSRTVEEFWNDIRVAHDHSLYRDLCGIVHETTNVRVPVDDPNVKPGMYTLVGRTLGMSTEMLHEVLDHARELLSLSRPLSSEKMAKVHNELLLRFNHFSLQHEGSDLGFDETELITKLLAGKDPKRDMEEDEMDKINTKVPGSEHDIKEAVNHIQVSQHSSSLPKRRLRRN